MKIKPTKSIHSDDHCPDIDELKSNLYKARTKLINKYGEPIGYGTTRIVFDAGNWVVKLPKDIYSFSANYNEASFGARELKNEIYAVCRLFHIYEVPVVWMEKVPHAKYTPDMPDWVSFIDCQQVGYNKQGKLVAYDYGNL